jgi:hypothetical protein
MRQLSQIETEIKTIHNSVDAHQQSLNSGGEGTLGKLQRSRLSKRLLLLTDIKTYLGGNPSEEFVKKELGRISTRIKLLDDSYPHWEKHNSPHGLDLKQKRDLYEKENNLKSLRNQQKVLEFLLS